MSVPLLRASSRFMSQVPPKQKWMNVTWKGSRTQKKRRASSNQHFSGDFVSFLNMCCLKKPSTISLYSSQSLFTPLGAKTKTTDNIRENQAIPSIVSCVYLQLPMDFHPEKPSKEVFSSDFRKKSLGLQNPLEFLSSTEMTDGNTLGPLPKHLKKRWESWPWRLNTGSLHKNR